MVDKFSNNATPKYLGYVYQVLIAIEQCFQAKANGTIWIECFGDVYDGNTSTEIKHHIKKTNLTSNSPEFWTTLKNLVVEDTDSFQSFVLHTTSTIQDNSIFDDWNELSVAAKYKKLKNHTPVPGIKADYDKAMVDQTKIKSILARLTIKSSQLGIKDKWEELVEDRIFTLIPDQYKEDAFHWVYGYVHKKAIADYKQWHIKVNDFRQDCERGLKPYAQGNIPFPNVKNIEVEHHDKSFLFVEDMRKINLSEKPIERAVSDYLRAKKSEMKLLEYEPVSMSEAIETYDAEVLESLESKKMQEAESLELGDINTLKASKTSRSMYHCILNSTHSHIMGVSDTQKYFRDGRIHQQVNESPFTWSFSEGDVE
jgi:hypothetical protein